ncbi:helix-turn-helix domain-containing protein [Azonexus sp.]|uniref:helix-turn-helix domain-containing protein n=1 Tax=Azonexus sp. TaxID=1872668 RepID=UPI0039E70173
MNALTESVQILRDAGGHPAFAVIPFADYQTLVKGKTKVEPGIPAAVVDLAMDNEWSAARAWREHKELTQTEVAQRMSITQGAYAQLEAKKSIRKSSREKIAKALGIHESQLDF